MANRRLLLASCLAAIAAPLVSSGQIAPVKVHRIGFIVSETPASQRDRIDAGGLVNALIERLSPDAAAARGLDPDRITYTPLAGLGTATGKARRDGPAIAVWEV